MSPILEISDTWGWVVTLGLSAMLAENSFRNGRRSYRFGFYLTGGNMLISMAAYSSEGGVFGGGLREAIAMLVISIAMYFAYLGFSVTLRNPKNVRCLRCEYVGFPAETDEGRTRIAEGDWQTFRNLSRQIKLNSASDDDR